MHLVALLIVSIFRRQLVPTSPAVESLGSGSSGQYAAKCSKAQSGPKHARGWTVCILVAAFLLASVDAQASAPVYRVGGARIGHATYAHWMRVAAIAQGWRTVPLGSDDRRCQRLLVRARHLSGAHARAACRQRFGTMNEEVGKLLIQGAWVTGEAASLKVSVTRSEVDSKFNQTRRAAFNTQADYRKFLRESGEWESDLKERVKVDLLAERIRKQVVSDVGEASVKSWISAFQVRWKARTSFAKRYRLSLCGSTF